MEERIWDFVHNRHKADKVIFKFNNKTEQPCELEHDTLLRQRKLLPPNRKCDLEIDNQRWLATEQKKNPIWRTVMAKPEVSIKGMKKTTHMEQSQTELKVPVLGSGRLQS